MATFTPSNVPHDLECPICLGLWNEPVCVTPCEHIFCKTCLATTGSGFPGSGCPVCRTSVASHAAPHRLLLGQMLAVPGTCGCGWTGSKEQFAAHKPQCTITNGGIDIPPCSSVPPPLPPPPAPMTDNSMNARLHEAMAHHPVAFPPPPPEFSAPSSAENGAWPVAPVVGVPVAGVPVAPSGVPGPFALSYLSDSNIWTPTDGATARAVMSALENHQGIVKYRAGNTEYIFDLIAKIQINTRTGTRRCISLVLGGDGLRDEFIVEYQTDKGVWEMFDRASARAVEACRKAGRMCNLPFGKRTYAIDPIRCIQTNTLTGKSRPIRFRS